MQKTLLKKNQTNKFHHHHHYSRPPPPPPDTTFRDTPCNFSEEEIHELTHWLVTQIFAFGKETTKKLPGSVENDELEKFIVNGYIEELKRYSVKIKMSNIF